MKVDNVKISIKDDKGEWVEIKPLTFVKPVKHVEFLLHKTTGNLLVNMYREMFEEAHFDMKWIITRAEWQNQGGE